MDGPHTPPAHGRETRHRAADLFDREPPPDYGLGWAESLARLAGDARARAVIVFRLADELFALSLDALLAVTDWRPIRTVPHRRDDALLGIANVQGELLVCVALEVLLDLPRPDVVQPPATARLLAVGRDGVPWVVPVADALALHEVVFEELAPVPATVDGAASPYVRGMFEWRERHVAVLDDRAVLASLQRRLA